MFRIGDFSRLTRVTVKALRHYDELGLLRPARVDSQTGYRFYSSAQLPRLNRILALKDLGLSLEQVGEILATDLSPDQLRTLLLIKQAEVRTALDQEQARLARIDALLRQIAEGEPPTDDVVVKRVEAQPVASIRRTVPSRPAIGSLFRELARYQQRHRVRATAWTTIWHDPDFREAEIDAEATIASADPLPVDGPVQPRVLPAVERMACVAHQGPSETIGAGCRALLGWIETNGYRVAGPERVRALEPAGPGRREVVLELQFPVEKDE